MPSKVLVNVFFCTSSAAHIAALDGVVGATVGPATQYEALLLKKTSRQHVDIPMSCGRLLNCGRNRPTGSEDVFRAEEEFDEGA